MDAHADRTRPFAMTWALFWTFAGMDVLAVALGFVGFRLDFPEDSVELSIYKSVQLLTLESGDSGKPALWPLAVELARADQPLGWCDPVPAQLVTTHAASAPGRLLEGPRARDGARAHRHGIRARAPRRGK